MFALSLGAGLAWGCVAVVLFLAMFRGLIPAPADLPLPLGIATFTLVAPFQVSILVEALFARGSYGLGELVFGTVACGVVMGATLGWLAHVVGRRLVNGG